MTLTRSAPPPVGPARYRAFLSYSHHDRSTAIAVQRGLQRLARPWYRPPALRVFRDDTDLTATPGLWSSIEEALLDSEFFILLASPTAAASPWVDREVGTWMDRKPPHRLMLALTHGELTWNGAAGGFDWAKTTVLPPNLRGAFREEPRWVDLRAVESGDLSLSNAAFRERVADLAAPLYETSKERLIGEDTRRKRRWNRLRNSVMVVLTVLLALVVAASILFLQQRNVALHQRDVAVSRQLINQSETLGETDPTISKLESIAAWRINPSNDARYAMLAAAAHPGIAALAGHTDVVYSVAFSPDGKTLASGSRDDTVRLWDVATQRQIGAPLTGHTSEVESVAFSPDGKTLASGSFDQTVRVWDVATHRQIHRHHRRGRLGGVQPRRQDPGQRQLRSDRAGVGCGLPH